MHNESGIIIEEDVVKASSCYVFSQLNASEIYDAFNDTSKNMGYVARHVLAELRAKKSRFKSVPRDFNWGIFSSLARKSKEREFQRTKFVLLLEEYPGDGILKFVQDACHNYIGSKKKGAVGGNKRTTTPVSYSSTCILLHLSFYTHTYLCFYYFYLCLYWFFFFLVPEQRP